MLPLELIVQLEGQAARNLVGGPKASPDVAQLQRVLAEFGVTLRPQHPGVPDIELSRYFIGELRGRDDGSRVLAALSALHAVTAAYAKPTAELP